MPKDNIERSIDKSSNSVDENFESLRYEGFGPEKVAVIVEALTNNKNRTASNIRTVFQKNGGSLGTQGSASHNFKQLGIIKIDKKEILEEKIFELAIDSGASECFSKKDFHEVHCDKNEIYDVKKNLEKTIKKFISTDICWVPINSVEIKGEKLKLVLTITMCKKIKFRWLVFPFVMKFDQVNPISVLSQICPHLS